MKLFLSTLALTAWAIAASPARADMLYVLTNFLDSTLRPGAGMETVTSSGVVNPFVRAGTFGSAAYDLAFGPNGDLFVNGGGGGG